MKKALLILFALILFVAPAPALYVQTNYACAQWPGSTTVEAGNTTTLADYMQTAGCQYVLVSLNASNGITAEASWYFLSGSSIFTTEAITIGSATQVKSPRLKITLYCPSVLTPEAIVYAY